MLLGAEMSLVGPPSLGLDMCQTTWREKLLQVYDHGICLRSSAISSARATGLVKRRPPPSWLPLLTHTTPPLIQLSRGDWLADDVPSWWRAGPADWRMPVW